MAMKTTRPRAFVRFAALALVAACGGDDGDGPVAPAPSVPTSIEVAPAAATLTYLGQTAPFNATVKDQRGAAMVSTVAWSSSDESVFTVDERGTVTAVANGSAALQAASGALTASASVTVRQRPAGLSVVSGGDQTGLRLTALPEPVVVRALDRGGFAVEGVELSFSPGTESGSVSREAGVTDENGEARTEWTLGGRFGTQTLVVSGPVGLRRSVSATATSDTPLPDLAIHEIAVSRADLTNLETVDVTVGIANAGDAPGPDSVPVRLTVGDVVLAEATIGALEPQDSATVAFAAVGPLEAGPRDLTAVVDPEGGLEEWEKANNALRERLVVEEQAVLELDVPATVSGRRGEVKLFRVELGAASSEPLTARLVDRSGDGSRDADMFLHYGERPDHQYRYRCLSGNQDSNEACQILPARRGVYHVAVHAFTAFGPAELTVSVGGQPTESFDIELVFQGLTNAARERTFREAADRWEAVIGQGVDDFAYRDAQAASGACPAVAAGETIDDVRIYVDVAAIDGRGQVLARAAPCSVRLTSFEGWNENIYGAVIRGAAEFDDADVTELEANGSLLDVATHEMGHVLGFGTVWSEHGLLGDPSVSRPGSPGDEGADTHFKGPLARAAFESLGGRRHAGAKVPVQSGGEAGSSDSHWRESVFGNELMTPFLSAEAEPLSRITVEAMADVGYGVVPSEAEPYRVRGPAARVGPGANRVWIDLSNDIADRPIGLFSKGRRVGTFHPRR